MSSSRRSHGSDAERRQHRLETRQAIASRVQTVRRTSTATESVTSLGAHRGCSPSQEPLPSPSHSHSCGSERDHHPRASTERMSPATLSQPVTPCGDTPCGDTHSHPSLQTGAGPGPADRPPLHVPPHSASALSQRSGDNVEQRRQNFPPQPCPCPALEAPQQPTRSVHVREPNPISERLNDTVIDNKKSGASSQGIEHGQTTHFRIRYRGNKDAAQTIFFLHGWPDTDEVFAAQYEALGEQYRIVSFTLPGYAKRSFNEEESPNSQDDGWCSDKETPKSKSESENVNTSKDVWQCGSWWSDGIPNDGFSFTSIVDQLHGAVSIAMAGRDPLTDRPVLIAHDWGASFAYHLARKYPSDVHRLVALDIGAHYDLSLSSGLHQIAYHWCLCLVSLFFVYATIAARCLHFAALVSCGRACVSATATVATKLVACVFFTPPPSSMQTAHCEMNYVYLQFWRGLFTKTLPPEALEWSPPPCPVLFLYGREKPYPFHSKRWLDHLDTRRRDDGLSMAVGVAGGHWFFGPGARSTRRVNSEIGAFIQAL